MTASPATRPRRRRARAGARDLPRGEWERLLREPVYLRPLPAPVPLHVMGRRRAQDSTATTTEKESR